MNVYTTVFDSPSSVVPALKIDEQKIKENMRQWRLAMEATHEMILAGLRLRIGPDEDLQQAYNQWYLEQRDLVDAERDKQAAELKRLRADQNRE